MLDNILSLAKEFIAIKSIAGNPTGLEHVLDTALLQLKEFTIERFEQKGSKSALIYPSKTRPDKFKIILNGHLDVVPGKEYQYIPKVEGNKLYGVGSMDMKANAACLIIAFKHVAHMLNYPIGLQLVTDEEIGGLNGTKYQVDNDVRTDFIIAGEPTNFNIVHKAKGILWLKVSSKGKTAHGAYPWRGDNAIWKMNEFLQQLKNKYPLLTEEQWITTINLSKIETSNTSFNKIPDDCTISLDIRFVPEDEKTILKSITSIVPPDFVVETLFQEPALFVDKNNSYIQSLQKITQDVTKNSVLLYGAQGSSDARHFTRVGCDGVEFGPIGGDIGTDSEWVDIPSLEKYFTVLTNFLTSYTN